MAKLNFSKVASTVMKKAPGLMAGAVASNFVATQINKMSGGKATPMVTAGGVIIAGALIPGLLGSSKKDDFFHSASEGMMAQGAVMLAKALNIPGMSGTTGMDSLTGAVEDSLTGTETYDSISGNSQD
ncbi:MAG: hypothetical protein EKK37_17365 [Sphingobacteriales bacterium]|nr:MAG: hypothetical protein EKK37_17365 [Sphingobacteriales bacterium]